LIHVYTGNGKGKTTAALGLIIRALGRGKKVCLIQFMKKNFIYGEIQFLSEHGDLDIYQFGTDKLVDPQNTSPIDHAEASRAIKKANEIIESREYDLLVLDEINVAVKWNLISLASQLKIFDIAEDTEIVMTGRYAEEKVINKADLVTEMKEIKHYYINGTPAREGIEF
jgi:cob(I)alamin adenosyltransferase